MRWRLQDNDDDMRKPKLPPDNRLDWRNPNMPLLIRGNIGGKVGLHSVEPQKVTAYYAAKMNMMNSDPMRSPPDYKHDPSYWWNKRNRK